jgi:hypothetical protein
LVLKYFEIAGVDDWTEFQRLMTLSVCIMKIPSPIYGFPRVEDVNKTDKDWWTPEDPRYQLLREIDLRGLITLNAQECNLEENEPVAPRGVVPHLP